MKTSSIPAAIAIWACLLGHGAPSVAGEASAGGAASIHLIEDGKSLYNQLCRNCHGINMVNSGSSSFDLRTFPSGDRDRFNTSVMKGKKTMPAWGDLLTPEDVDALWAYVMTGGVDQ